MRFVVGVLGGVLYCHPVAAQPQPVSTPAATAAQPGKGGAAKESASQLADRVQRFYDATRDLHAHFDQTLTSQVGGAKKASGEVWLKKPGRMRWDYAKPEKKLMVADGQTLWVYEPEDEQAFKQDLRGSTLPLSVSFLVGQGNLKSEFDVSVVPPPTPDLASGDQVVLKLVPKTATTAYRHLLFVVDPKTGQVLKTQIYDQQGGVNQLVFGSIESNRGVDDAKFRFSPPAGTKILKP
jgi:outer membrane lipoprotein carrier protein